MVVKFPRQVLCLAVVILTGCATLPPGAHDPRDRFERFNRSVFAFNQSLDKHVARPVAVTYVKVAPQPVRTGVTNFFDNLHYPVVVVNQLLQGKVKLFARDSARLVVNTTIGIGGLFDPAARFGLDAHNEDFGQTLGYWGVGPGPYVMLPVLGPSTVRDTVGKVADHYTEPKTYLKNQTVSWGLSGVELLSDRAGAIEAKDIVDRAYDPYAFMRNAYLQRRQFLIYDGNPPEEQGPEETDDDADAPAAKPPAKP